MREIKFRAWDKKRKIMIGSDYPENWGDDKDEWYADIHFMDLVAIEGISKNEDFELMQYTGLKDKKGKEIYEGDICKDQHENYCIGQVVWKTWCWDIPIQGDEDDCIPITNKYEVEVIGNIHENPELLKK